MRGFRCAKCAKFRGYSWASRETGESRRESLEKMNRTTYGVISSHSTQNLKYDVMNKTSAKKIWEILASKYLPKSVENCLHLKRRFYYFQLKRETFISDHINIYVMLLADLANVNVMIEDEDKALILLSSLPDERDETFVLTLIDKWKNIP